jgi:hypothetical protein
VEVATKQGFTRLCGGKVFPPYKKARHRFGVGRHHYADRRLIVVGWMERSDIHL